MATGTGKTVMAAVEIDTVTVATVVTEATVIATEVNGI